MMNNSYENLLNTSAAQNENYLEERTPPPRYVNQPDNDRR